MSNSKFIDTYSTTTSNSSDYLSSMANMENSASSAQQTANPAMFLPPLPTEPLPSSALMDNWLFNANAEKDEPTSSVPSATSSKIEIGVDLENINITDLINNVIGNPNIMDLVCSNSAKPVTKASIPARIESDNWPMPNTQDDIKTDNKKF